MKFLRFSQTLSVFLFTIASVFWAAVTPVVGDDAGKPDLVVVSFGVRGDNAIEGQGIYFVATIKNQGTAPTPAHTTIAVTFSNVTGLAPEAQDQGKMLTYSSQFDGPLNPGETHDVQADQPWKTQAGTFSIRAFVDDVRRIDESDRTNNAMTHDITVAQDPALEAAMDGNSDPSTYTPSINDLVPDGDFEDPSAKPPIIDGNADVVSVDGTHALLFKNRLVYGWNAPDKIIMGGDYIFSCRIKSFNVGGATDPNAGMRLFLWACQPTLHEPPPGGAATMASWNGSFNWKHFETRFKMPRGVSRFIIYFDDNAPNGWSYVDDISFRPSDDQPLDLPENAPVFGADDREQMTWIWNDSAFPWVGGAGDGNMGPDQFKAVTPQDLWFRRSIPAPNGFLKAQATFVGDDSAVLLVNGKEVGSNGSIQDIERVPLDGVLKPGDNEVIWKAHNAFGPGGLLGRVEWTTANGKSQVFPTNDKWECSSDQGASWKPASQVAVPVPASTQFDWCYPHLPKSTYDLTYDLPSDFTDIRLAVRSPGSFRVLADDKDIFSTVCCSHSIKIDLAEDLVGKNVQLLTIRLEDISQPAAGAGELQIKTTDGWKTIPFSEFSHEQRSPQAVKTFFSAKSWPTNIGSFDAAASRPIPNKQSHLEPWAANVLAQSATIFQLGSADGTSGDFGPLEKGPSSVDVPLTDLKACPNGLEGQLRPELNINFKLGQIPANGAAFVLGVEDADAVVTSVGVFVNGIFCGMPQILGYDLFPGGRLINRAWLVTVPPERLQTGTNTVTLRLLPSYYRTDTTTENQSQDYIKMMGLGDPSKSPYKASWVLWNYLGLYALNKPVADPIDGRPVWMGVNLGNLAQSNADAWRDYVIRDFSYLGLTGTNAPIRYGIFDQGQLSNIDRTDPSLPNNQTMGDFQLSSLVAQGMAPHLLCEPGRYISSPDEVADSNGAKVLGEYGKYFNSMEIGNEVDHPNMGWDSLKLADAFATIQRQAVCGQMLKLNAPNKNMTVVGQGWYHAWDFSVVDAQARKETPDDPAFTDALSTHDYGTSYIIPAVGYYLLYGSNAPKPIWTTECGAYSGNPNEAADFDSNIRGNLSFATYIMQYVPHAEGDDIHFSLFSAKDKNAHIMERGRAYRRLVHAFSMHGTPLPWQYADTKAMQDKLVLVNPVDAGKWIKISFVNFSKESQPIDMVAKLPLSGDLEATRYGDGETVESATTKTTIHANPQARFQETLRPGETVEYLIVKPD